MKVLTGKEIRETWIKFFEKRGHKFLPGVNLIPNGDKSLLWVNAGVTGLKKGVRGAKQIKQANEKTKETVIAFQKKYNLEQTESYEYCLKKHCEINNEGCPSCENCLQYDNME